MHVNLTETGHTAPEADASIDLILQGSIFHDPWTIIRVKRSLNTGDQNDVIIGVSAKWYFISQYIFKICFSFSMCSKVITPLDGHTVIQTILASPTLMLALLQWLSYRKLSNQPNEIYLNNSNTRDILLTKRIHNFDLLGRLETV